MLGPAAGPEHTDIRRARIEQHAERLQIGRVMVRHDDCNRRPAKGKLRCNGFDAAQVQLGAPSEALSDYRASARVAHGDTDAERGCEVDEWQSIRARAENEQMWGRSDYLQQRLATVR